MNARSPGEPKRRGGPLSIVEMLRARCLAFPEVSERSSWGHPNFRAGKRTFAAFERVQGRPSIAFRLPPRDVVAALARKNFFETPYGRGVWVSIWTDRPFKWKLVDDLLDRSYRVVALKRMIRALDAAGH